MATGTWNLLQSLTNQTWEAMLSPLWVIVPGVASVIAYKTLRNTIGSGALSSSGMNFDYQWQHDGAAVGIDITASKIFVKKLFSKAAIVDLSDIRDCSSHWIEHSKNGKVWRDSYTVVLLVKDLKRPRIVIPTVKLSQTDQVIEIINRGLEGVA